MKHLVKILTVLLIINISAVRVFASGDDTFTTFTDVDPDYLTDISSSYQLSDFKYNRSRYVVIDYAVAFADQMQFEVSGTHTLSFTGSYYDNTITAVNACSSSGYSYSTSVSSGVDIVEIEPGIYGSFNHSTGGLAVNFGLTYDYQHLNQSQISGSSFSNQTQACHLVGMESGDGAIDGTTLLQAGYEKRTITYNDGTSAGHTATFYVPGSESINISNSDLDDLIAAVYANVINHLTVDWHYEYELGLTSNGSKVMPSYGYIYGNSFINVALDADKDYEIIPYSLDHCYINYNKNFISNLYNDSYYYNYFNLVWADTEYPVFKFRSERFRSTDVLNINQGSYNTDNANPIYLGSEEFKSGQLNSSSITVNQATILKYPSYDLTSGKTLPNGIAGNSPQFKVYKYVDAGRLGLFNQLGQFLQNQFNRISNLIGSIDGGGDTVNDIENTYNVDIDTDLNNYISNFITRKNAIDLTQPEYNLPSGNNVNQLSDIPAETIKLFTDNGVGVLIFAPLILGILRLIL